jgi:hypothetical protein
MQSQGYATNNLADEVGRLEAKLQGMLMDQHEDEREIARTRTLMKARAKLIGGLSDELDELRSTTTEAAQ